MDTRIKLTATALLLAACVATCKPGLSADRMEVRRDVYMPRKLVVVDSDGSRRVLSVKKDPLFLNRYILYNGMGKRVGVVKPDPLYNDRWEVEVDASVSRSK